MVITPPSEALHFVLCWNHDGRGLYSSYTAPASRMDGVISPGTRGPHATRRELVAVSPTLSTNAQLALEAVSPVIETHPGLDARSIRTRAR